MMQAAAVRYGDHLSDPAWHGRARVGAILVERQMRAGALVIVDVSVQIVAGYWDNGAPMRCGSSRRSARKP